MVIIDRILVHLTHNKQKKRHKISIDHGRNNSSLSPKIDD